MTKEPKWTKTTYVDRHGREEHVFAKEGDDIREDGKCFFNPDNVPKRLLGRMEDACDGCPWLSQCKRDSVLGGE